MPKACKAVAGTKGAAAEGGRAAFSAWSCGEHPSDCRICGELLIDCNFPAPPLRGVIRGYWKDRRLMQMELASVVFYHVVAVFGIREKETDPV